MKEYICKEDLMRAHFENTPITDNEEIVFTHVLAARWIKNIPTVTKADICREFAEWLVDKHCLVSPNENERTVEDIINIYLSEMEEKDNG